MAGKAKPTARQAFDDNVADAEALVSIVRALRSRRVRRMRREMRERLGIALGIARKHWDGLDCIESDDLFVSGDRSCSCLGGLSATGRSVTGRTPEAARSSTVINAPEAISSRRADCAGSSWVSSPMAWSRSISSLVQSGSHQLATMSSSGDERRPSGCCLRLATSGGSACSRMPRTPTWTA